MSRKSDIFLWKLWQITILRLLFFRAFVKAYQTEKDIVPLGINLTPKQLFWVGFAQDFCLFRGEYKIDIKDVLKYKVTLQQQKSKLSPNQKYFNFQLT